MQDIYRNLALLVLPVVICTMVGCAVPDFPNTPVPPDLETDPVTGRQYWIYVPQSYRPNRPSPLVVTCHGTIPFDTSDRHIRTWKWLAEQHRCIVLAPALVGSDGIFGDGPVAAMLANERFILSLISMLGYRYNIDRANIMITGFSGGGFTTYWVGLRHPDLFSVIVASNCNFSERNLAGWHPILTEDVRLSNQDRPTTNSGSPNRRHGLSVMVYWGEYDPALIVSQSAEAVRYLNAHGIDVKSDILADLGHERTPRMAMAFFRRHHRPPVPSLPVSE